MVSDRYYSGVGTCPFLDILDIYQALLLMIQVTDFAV